MRTRDLVVATVACEAAGVLIAGVVALGFWLLVGSWIGPVPWTVGLLAAAGPVGAFYRSRPPRRRLGAAAGCLMLLAGCTGVLVVTDRWLPQVEEHDLSVAVGLLTAMPAAAAVFALCAGRPREP